MGFLSIFLSGAGGSRAAFDPLAVVVFGHAVAVLVSSWIDRRRPVSPQRGLRVFASVAILVWFAYYASRPNAAYLSSLLLPYGILLLDTLRAVTLGTRGMARIPWKVGLSLAALALVVIPHAVLTARLEWPSFVRGIDHARRGTPPRAHFLQGVWLPDDARTRRIVSQAEFLRATPGDGPLVFITPDNLLVSKEAGVWPDLPLPVANPFTGTLTADHYERLLEGLRSPEVERIYFPSWRGLSRKERDYSPNIQKFFQMLSDDLSETFEHRRRVSGWEERVRK